MNDGLKIDIGCGSCKKKGYIGVDILDVPGVDHVIDMMKEPLPFPESSVSQVFSSHFLEHLDNPGRVFVELSRVVSDGAELELWTPYTWSNSAFIYDHAQFFNEDHYLHMCVWYCDFWRPILNSSWQLKEFQYVFDSEALVDLYHHQIDLLFALKYFKCLVKEFCAHIVVRKSINEPVVTPRKTWSLSRDGEKYAFPFASSPPMEELDKALNYYQNQKVKDYGVA